MYCNHHRCNVCFGRVEGGDTLYERLFYPYMIMVLYGGVSMKCLAYTSLCGVVYA